MSSSQSEPFDPQKPAATLLRLAQHAPARDVLQALKWAHQAGVFQWHHPANQQGQTLLDAWMEQRARGMQQGLSVEVLAAFHEWSAGEVWSRQDVHGETFFVRWMREHHRTNFMDDDLDQALAEVIRRTDRRTVTSWTDHLLEDPVDREPLKANDSVVPLIGHLLNHGALHALHACFEHGMTLLGHGAEGNPLAKNLNHPSLWTAYLQQGGDPDVPVHVRDELVRPLWNHLRHRWSTDPTGRHSDTIARRSRALHQAVNAWALKHHEPQLLEAQNVEYWAALNERGADGSTMKSRPEWPTLNDEHGRTPMMVLVRHDAKWLKEFWTVKKAEEGLSTLDRDGRSLWFYLLAHQPRHAPNGTIAWLSAHVPLRMDHQGWGLVQQVMIAGSAFANPQLMAEDWPDAWCTASDHQRWWGDERAQNALSQWMLERSHVSNRGGRVLASTFQDLSEAAQRAPWPLSPALYGALVLNELAIVVNDTGDSEVDARFERVARWLDSGAFVQGPHQSIVAALSAATRSDRTVHPTVSGLLGRLEGNLLRQGLADDAAHVAPTVRKRL